MREADRRVVRERYGFRCGYYGVSETDTGAELTIDHFQPRSQGGRDELDNLVYCCHACNEFKGDEWQPAATQRILHPLLDNMAEHLTELENGTLQALSETGAFHLECLQLNRPGLVAHRREKQRQTIALQEYTLLVERLLRLENRVDELQVQIETFRSRN